MSGPGRGTRSRTIFAERFALLYAEAGNPPLKQVESAVRQARRIDARGRPIRISNQRISDWRAGRNVPSQFPALLVVLEVLVGLAGRRQPTPVVPRLYDLRDWHERWDEAVASPASADAEPAEPAETAPVDDGVCPYLGLASFSEANAGWFFGRDRATGKLVELLTDAARTQGIVALVGASGAGKSSILRAGLIPALGQGALAHCPVTTMAPGKDPLRELAAHIPALEPLVEESADEAGFEDRVRAAIAAHAGPDTRSILIVDQFEDAFILCESAARRERFVRALHAAATPAAEGQAPPALVVLGLRADFYQRCLDYPELAEALQDRQLVLGAMATAELRTAVSGPARAVGLQLEPGLVELILRDMSAGMTTGAATRGSGGRAAYDAGTLPLLSHALLATWQRRQTGRLTIAGYRATGGIRGAVAATAERAWDQLTSPERDAARQLLLRLVHLGTDTRDVRRRSTRAELLRETADLAASEHALEVLSAARLVTLDADSVEIAHEALLPAWPRLRGWLDADRAGNLLRQRLEGDADAWSDSGRDPALLYRGSRLGAAQQLVRRTQPVRLTPVAREFLATSARHQRRLTWTGRVAVAAVLVFALVAASLAVVAVRQRDDAQFQAVVADANQLAATNPSLSAQLYLVAHQMRPDDEGVDDKLLSTQSTPLAMPLVGHTGAVYLTSYSPNGKVLATASYDRTVRLWDVADPAHPRPLGAPLTGHTSWVSSAVFSPDGQLLATAGDDGEVIVWNVADPAHPVRVGAPFTGHDGTIYLVAFSPDGRTLATADQDATVRLWNLSDPARPTPLGAPLTGHRGAVRSVAFSPDGHLLAAGGDDDTIRLWNVLDPSQATPVGPPLTGHTGTVHSVAFSPDSRTLASGSADKTVRLWNVLDPSDPTPIGTPLTGHVADVWSVAFSPNGQLLASGSTDGTARLWNVTNLANPAQLGSPLVANGGGVNAIGFSPDGRTLATGSEDGIVRLWSLPTTVLVGHVASLLAAGFSPNGKLLATAGSDDAIRLWNVLDPSDPLPLGTLSGDTSYVNSIAFSPDSRVLATASGDQTVRLWNVADPAHATEIGPPIPVDTRYGNALAFSPTRPILAATSTDETVQLWNVADPARPVPLGTPLSGDTSYINSIAFSPDGTLLATASSDGTARLWNVADPGRARALGRPISADASQVRQAVFSPDGHTLATASEDKTVRLYNISDPADPTPIGAPLTGHTDIVTSVAFSPDGHTLASGGADNAVLVWNVADPSNPSLTASLTTPSGVNQVAISPDGRTLVTADQDDTAALWNLDVDQAVQRICTTTNGTLTRQDWSQYLPQLSYRSTC